MHVWASRLRAEACNHAGTLTRVASACTRVCESMRGEQQALQCHCMDTNMHRQQQTQDWMRASHASTQGVMAHAGTRVHTRAATDVYKSMHGRCTATWRPIPKAGSQWCSPAAWHTDTQPHHSPLQLSRMSALAALLACSSAWPRTLQLRQAMAQPSLANANHVQT